MNLRLVHAILIVLSAALAVVFGIWCLTLYGRGDGSCGLVVYDSWFLRKTRTLR